MAKKVEYILPKFNLPKLLAHIQKLVDKAPDGVVQLIIDLFCGAGGTSEGFEQALLTNKKIACIIAGINHDIKAIYSQAVNHPLAYYTSEDIRLANLEPIKALLDIVRTRFPDCPIILWASLECTNHSNAKGGQSRDEDSRTLAWDLNRYVQELSPDGVWIENVKEFEIWGPLIEKEEWFNKKGKKMKTTYPPSKAGELDYYTGKINSGEIGTCPLTFKYEGKGKKKHLIDYGPTWVTDWRFAGTYFDAWTKEINTYGYHFQKRILNAADFGAPTNRYRFFVLFMKEGWPIAWPEPSHSKEGGTGLFAKPKHVPVKTCLDFSVEGRSVFEPGHVDSEKTWERIYEGLIKFVAGGKDAYNKKKNTHFLMKYMSNPSKDKVSKGASIEEPSPTITTQVRLNLMEACDLKSWIIKYMSDYGKDKVNPGSPIDEPSLTLTTMNHFGLINVKTWIGKYYSSHNNTKQNAGQGIDVPCDTVTTRGAGAKIDAEYIAKAFLDVIYGNGYASSLNEPAPTVRCKDGQSLVEPEFLVHQQGQSKTRSLDDPSPTLMTKEKLSLIGIKYFISKAFKSGQKNTSIEDPAGSLTTIPKADLVKVEGWIGDEQFGNKGSALDQPLGTITASRHWHYLYNPGWFGHVSDVNEPSVCVIARQDKAPLSIATVEQGDVALIVPIFDTDTPMMVKIKEFMVLYDIYDIKKRMLMIKELLKIQSFPENYYLAGTQTDQKKFIGNAVPPKVARAISEANYIPLHDFIIQRRKMAA